MKLLVLCVSTFVYTGCMTNHNIEERCLMANLQIEKLTIEDTLRNDALAKVTCVKRK